MTIKNLLLLLLLILLSLLSYFYFGKIKFSTNKSTSKSISLENQKKETDQVINQVKNYQLPSGEQTYNLSHGIDVVGPKATQIIFNPLRAKRGEEQTISVTFPVTEKVTSAELSFNTDSVSNQKVSLQKTPDPKTNTWSATWEFGDNANSKYNVELLFVGVSGSYKNVMRFL